MEIQIQHLTWEIQIQIVNRGFDPRLWQPQTNTTFHMVGNTNGNTYTNTNTNTKMVGNTNGNIYTNINTNTTFHVVGNTNGNTNTNSYQHSALEGGVITSNNDEIK